MKIMKDKSKKIRSKGRMDADNRWWLAELLPTDCEKDWLNAAWEVAMQKWCDRLEEMNRKDKRRKMEDLHQQR